MYAISQLFHRAFSSSSISKLKFKETHLRELVDTFKKHTQDAKFRRKTTFYEHTVNRLLTAKHFELIEEILEDQKKYKDISTEEFTVRLISLYGISGMFDHARQVFDEMPERKCGRTVLSLNALLGACVNSRKFDLVGGFFEDLPRRLGIRPDVVSFNTVIKAFCEMGALDSAVSMFGEMEKEGVRPDLSTFNNLFDGLYKKGRFLYGEKMWRVMEQYGLVPDIVSYNMKLHGLVFEERMEEAVGLVEEIKDKGLKVEVDTYNIAFQGLCRNGKYLQQVKRLYDDMMKIKCAPDRMTFATLLTFACDTEDFWFASRLCRQLFYRKCRLNQGDLLQNVINGLVRQSQMSEADILVRLGKESKYSCYHSLKMPRLYY